MTASLGPLTVWDTDGRPVRIETLWADRAVVLVFVRHFGCLFCRQQVMEMDAYTPSIRSRGAELFVIGNGSVEEARAFRASQALQCQMLTDPARLTFRALGMPRGFHTVLRPSVLVRAVKARQQGFRQSGVAGDPYQQGGVVVIAKGGQELYRFVSRAAGHRPRPKEVIAALERASKPTASDSPSG